MNDTPPTDDDPRIELARLVHATRRLVAAEREGGIVTLPGVPAPPADDTPSSVPARAPAAAPERRQRPQEEAPPRRTAPALHRPRPRPPARGFVPKVRPMDLPEDWLSRFGDLAARVDACRRCSLGAQRTCAVFGEGSPDADLVFCGEAPGFEEDKSGRPFVGAAGELLSAMIERGMRMRREDVFVLNTLKCRPPRNRAPLPIEVNACRPFLEEQLAVIQPKVVVALGNHAVRAILGESPGITRMRGRVIDALGAKVVPTYHPAYLLRNPAAKREAWEDLKTVMTLLGRSPD
jgi:DNA polymerase